MLALLLCLSRGFAEGIGLWLRSCYDAQQVSACCQRFGCAEAQDWPRCTAASTVQHTWRPQPEGDSHVKVVVLQVSSTLLQPPAGEQIIDVAFYRDGHLAILLAAQQRTGAGVRLLLVPTDDLQYLPDLPADSNIMQVRADFMRRHAVLLLCSPVLGLLLSWQDCPRTPFVHKVAGALSSGRCCRLTVIAFMFTSRGMCPALQLAQHCSPAWALCSPGPV